MWREFWSLMFVVSFEEEQHVGERNFDSQFALVKCFMHSEVDKTKQYEDFCL